MIRGMDKATLKQELERRGHGAQSALAEFLGVHPSIVSRMLNSPRKMSVEEAAKIGEWLSGVPVQARAEAPPPVLPPQRRTTQRQTMQRAAPLDFRREDMLPVWAAVQGGEEGAMLITTSPVDRIPRPRELLEVVDAFAVFLVGDSMSPRYDHGDQLYVHPHRPPGRGDDCLFVRQVDETSFLGLAKTLVRPSDRRWHVKQYNPAREFDLDRRVWKQAWKIIGKMNRS
jgi:phage repressor protein C with HTH and peptisase S24 domain